MNALQVLGLSDSVLLGIGTAVVLGVTGLWKYLDLPLYWLFRHLVGLCFKRDPDVMRALIAGLFPDEMKRNAETALKMQRLQDGMDGITENMKPLSDLAHNVGIMARELAQATKVLTEVVQGQTHHGEYIARLDERIKAWDGSEKRHHDAPPPNGRRRTRSTDFNNTEE